MVNKTNEVLHVKLKKTILEKDFSNITRLNRYMW